MSLGDGRLSSSSSSSSSEATFGVETTSTDDLAVAESIGEGGSGDPRVFFTSTKAVVVSISAAFLITFAFARVADISSKRRVVTAATRVEPEHFNGGSHLPGQFAALAAAHCIFAFFAMSGPRTWFLLTDHTLAWYAATSVGLAVAVMRLNVARECVVGECARWQALIAAVVASSIVAITCKAAFAASSPAAFSRRGLGPLSSALASAATNPQSPEPGAQRRGWLRGQRKGAQTRQGESTGGAKEGSPRASSGAVGPTTPPQSCAKAPTGDGEPPQAPPSQVPPRREGAAAEEGAIGTTSSSSTSLAQEGARRVPLPTGNRAPVFDAQTLQRLQQAGVLPVHPVRSRVNPTFIADGESPPNKPLVRQGTFGSVENLASPTKSSNSRPSKAAPLYNVSAPLEDSAPDGLPQPSPPPSPPMEQRQGPEDRVVPTTTPRAASQKRGPEAEPGSAGPGPTAEQAMTAAFHAAAEAMGTEPSSAPVPLSVVHSALANSSASGAKTLARSFKSDRSLGKQHRDSMAMAQALEWARQYDAGTDNPQVGYTAVLLADLGILVPAHKRSPRAAPTPTPAGPCELHAAPAGWRRHCALGSSACRGSSRCPHAHAGLLGCPLAVAHHLHRCPQPRCNRC